MEQQLLKLARQLDALDEASLMSLWDKYADTVNRFEPTKRWEEAAIVFSLIQAKRWKNQLFNYHWAQQVRPEHANVPHSAFKLESSFQEKSEAKTQKATQISFSSKKQD